MFSRRRPRCMCSRRRPSSARCGPSSQAPGANAGHGATGWRHCHGSRGLGERPGRLGLGLESDRPLSAPGPGPVSPAGLGPAVGPSFAPSRACPSVGRAGPPASAGPSAGPSPGPDLSRARALAGLGLPERRPFLGCTSIGDEPCCFAAFAHGSGFEEPVLRHLKLPSRLGRSEHHGGSDRR